MMIDVTSILPTVRVPTLVLHRQTDALVPVAAGRALAAQIPDAKYIEYPGGDHAPWAGDVEALVGDIKEFVTGDRESSAFDLERVLATVLFTDIVDSTRSAAAMGDQQWGRLLESHDQMAKQFVDKHRGNLVKSTGDGILATFDGPGRAVDARWRSNRDQPDWPAAARRPPRRRDRIGRPGRRRDCGACGRPRHGAMRAERSPCFKGGHRSRRWRRDKVHRTRVARTQGSARSVGFVFGQPVAFERQSPASDQQPLLLVSGGRRAPVAQRPFDPRASFAAHSAAQGTRAKPAAPDQRGRRCH